MHADRDGNQSGAEKDNSLLFGEQWMFFKSKMADVLRQSGVELEIQDGGAHESAAMLENRPPRLDRIVGAAILNS